MDDRRIHPVDARVRNANRLVAGLSAVLAFIAWTAIRDAISNEHVVRDVPIIVRASEGYTVLDLAPDTADIRFRGARSDLVQLERERDRVSVEVEATQPRTPGRPISIRLSAANVRNPSSARPIRIEPDEISFSIDREGERLIPVRPEVSDDLPEGFEVVGKICTPESVLLKGPLARIQGVEAVRTLPIDLQGRVQSFRARATVLPPAHLTGTRVEPDRVLVDVTIIERSAARHMTNVPVRIVAAAGRIRPMTPEPEAVIVHLQGRAAALDALDPASIWAFVDISGVEDGDADDLPVRMYPPAGIRAVSIEPPTVRIKVNR